MTTWRVLIVDDSPAMRSFIRRVIQLCGAGDYEFLEAGNGRQGLELIDREHPDIVLTDINMPEMNGEDLLRALSVREASVTPPVIVVSTDSTHTRVHNMTELGATAYLQKPFTPEDMRCVLEEALGRPAV